MTAVRPTLRDRHVERGEDEARAQVRRHRPADDPATPDIEDDRQIQRARSTSGCR